MTDRELMDELMKERGTTAVRIHRGDVHVLTDRLGGGCGGLPPEGASCLYWMADPPAGSWWMWRGWAADLKNKMEAGSKL